MSSRFIEGAILMYLRRKGQVAKNKSLDGRDEYETQMEDNEQGFEGAYVKAPIPGRYDWVFDLDLTSMYPNIIISLNLSPETKVAVINKIEYDDSYVEDRTKEIREDYENLGDSVQKKTPFAQYLDQRLYAFNARLFAQDKIGKYHVGSTIYTNDEFKQLITQTNLSVASNGVMCKQYKTGVIPEILVKWFDERKDLRKLAKK
jgi:DNA polymerase elongation subunit (family B)